MTFTQQQQAKAREKADRFREMFSRLPEAVIKWHEQDLEDNTADTITATVERVREKVEGAQAHIRLREGENLEEWSDTGKVAYFYLDSTLTALNTITSEDTTV